MKNHLDIALKYHRAGFRCIPVTESKTPACGSWKRFMEAQSEQDIREIFAKDSHGIALLMGIGGLECIDVDEKYSLDGQLMANFMRLNDEVSGNSAPFTSLTVVRTVSGGYHILYRCDAPEGSQKLANRPATEEERKSGDTVKVLIETRGVGGYIVACPTPGYEVEFGRMSDIPHISMGQRLDILRCAKMFDDCIELAPMPSLPATLQPQGGEAPWDKYNDQADAVALLQNHGWSFVYENKDRVVLRRPGDTKSKTSGNWHKQLRVFITHSTSTDFIARKGYTAYGIYTILEHRGDFSASAKALLQSGYGTSNKQPIPAPQAAIGIPAAQPITQKSDPDAELRAFIRSTKFDITAPIKEDKATLFTHQNGIRHKIAGPGMVVAAVGPQKSSKTSIVAAITASGISAHKDPILSFEFDIEGKNAVYFDTEQSGFFYKRTQEMIYRMAGLYQNTPQYSAYHLRRLPAEQRLRGIDIELAGRKDLGLIVIDGLVDLLINFNSETESARVMEHLLKWSDETKAMIVTVLHLTKSDGFMRGHLGTALQNKYDAGIQVNKDGEESIFRVKCRDSRFAPFPPFDFTKDERGYPVFGGSPSVKQPDFIPELVRLESASPAIQRMRRGDDEEIPF